MVNKQLLDYAQKSIEGGYSVEQISIALSQQGWDAAEINEALLKAQEITNQKILLPVAPLAPKKSEWNFELKSLSASQILLYLGGLIVVLAGVIYIGINWQEWSSGGRIFAILLPMLVVYGVGISLWFGGQYRKQSIVFIFTGSLLFPLFLSVTFKELNMFAEPWSNNFGLTVWLLTLGLYLLSSFIFRYPIWSFLCPATGLFVYYYLLKVLGIENLFEKETMAWAFLLPGVLYLFLGYFYENVQKRDYSKYPYFLGVFTIFFSLSWLAMNGSFLKTFIGDAVGWSTIVVGIIYLALAWLSEKLKNLKLDEAGKYKVFFDLVGTFAILGAIFYLSTDGKKPAYETLLLFSSLGFIFASIPKLSRQFLYIGTLFLVIYIFNIGGEYFQNQVGWPITLFIAGLISMGIGFGIEKLRRQYFPIKT
ncbi:MAG: hypothetical protein Q8P88_02390 [Candidatus Jorgensenbacteria bacterium]|nr:hypothetical protein [Candidatus Jorgensenbacteria bacterium]